MPAMASRGKGRRTINEINMVPFIDVMLVLLIIFMVTAPMLTPSSINVPSVGKSGKNVPKVRADVIVQKDGSLVFKADGNERGVTVQSLGATATSWLKDQPEDTPVLISADKTVPYDSVMQVYSQLKQAGVQRIALAVQPVATR